MSLPRCRCSLSNGVGSSPTVPITWRSSIPRLKLFNALFILKVVYNKEYAVFREQTFTKLNVPTTVHYSAKEYNAIRASMPASSDTSNGISMAQGELPFSLQQIRYTLTMIDESKQTPGATA